MLRLKLDLNEFLSRQYDEDKYHCVHFLCDVWEHATGDDIRPRFGKLLNEALNAKNIIAPMRMGFEKLDKPVNPCIVLFQGKKMQPHVGMWFNRKVIHLWEEGAEYIPIKIAALGFNGFRFYR